MNKKSITKKRLQELLIKSNLYETEVGSIIHDEDKYLEYFISKIKLHNKILKPTISTDKDILDIMLTDNYIYNKITGNNLYEGE
jgi:hypothetical protein